MSARKHTSNVLVKSAKKSPKNQTLPRLKFGTMLEHVRYKVELEHYLNGEVHRIEVISDAFQIRISPSVAELQRELSLVYQEANYSVDDFIRNIHQINGEDDSNSSRSYSFIFIISLLADLEAWGAKFEFYRSQLYVSLPNLTSGTFDNSVKDKIQKSLVRLRGTNTSYQPFINEDQAIEILSSGQIELTEVQDVNSNYADIFRSGITTWSMPYRTREGRSRRFILFGILEDLKVPMGLLEIGDEVPINPPRDALMGLDIKYEEVPTEDLLSLATRFEKIRKCLLPDGLPKGWNGDVKDLISNVEEIVLLGKGRGGTFKEVGAKKRLAYLARLINAEAACRGLTKDKKSGFQEGLRVLRDLSVPRVNVELVICGALPPFGSLLVGKLVASMGCHPRIRDFVDRDFGIIAKEIFDTSELAKHLPRSGTLLVTTKGLYPGHSSQYNGVNFPVVDGGKGKLIKIGDTVGQTTSHLAAKTMKYAALSSEALGATAVSRVFGSGGGKRQRTISNAVRALGLPNELAFASISRPIYAFSLVSNLGRMILFNEDPQWRTLPYDNKDGQHNYCSDALKIWKDKWLVKSKQRALRLT
jgi:hypothetical protein